MKHNPADADQLVEENYKLSIVNVFRLRINEGCKIRNKSLS